MNTLDLTCLWIGRAIFYFGGSCLSLYLLGQIAWRTFKYAMNHKKLWQLFIKFIVKEGPKHHA